MPFVCRSGRRIPGPIRLSVRRTDCRTSPPGGLEPSSPFRPKRHPACRDGGRSCFRLGWYNAAMELGDATQDDLRERAVTSLKKKRDFRTHLFIYVTVNAMLVVIWAITSDGGLFWPIFPILGWGIGVAWNAWDVYGRKPLTEEEIQREAQKLRS